MRTMMKPILCILLVTATTPLLAQQRERPATSRNITAEAGEPDVVLDIPHVTVDNITLDVERLDVHLSLDAVVGNLVHIKAGADAGIDNVRLEIVGVDAEAYLVVRLDRVAEVIERTLDTIDENPEMLMGVLDTVDRTVGTVGSVADTALQPDGVVSQAVGTVGQTLDNVTETGGLLSQTVNTLGQTVQRTVDTTGNIVERTLDETGRVVSEQAAGNVSELELLRETERSGGGVVRRVRDAAGAIIEYTVDRSGKILDSRVVSRPDSSQ